MRNILFFSLLLFFVGISCNKKEFVSEGWISPERAILDFRLEDEFIGPQITRNVNVSRVVATVFPGTDISALTPEITVSQGATISPVSGETINFTNQPVIYTVTAQDGQTREWEVFIEEGQLDPKYMHFVGTWDGQEVLFWDASINNGAPQPGSGADWDNRITFHADGTYELNPGQDGEWGTIENGWKLLAHQKPTGTWFYDYVADCNGENNTFIFNKDTPDEFILFQAEAPWNHPNGTSTLTAFKWENPNGNVSWHKMARMVDESQFYGTWTGEEFKFWDPDLQDGVTVPGSEAEWDNIMRLNQDGTFEMLSGPDNMYGMVETGWRQLPTSGTWSYDSDSMVFLFNPGTAEEFLVDVIEWGNGLQRLVFKLYNPEVDRWSWHSFLR